VAVGSNYSIEERMELVRRNLEFERDSDHFRDDWRDAQDDLRKKIAAAKELLQSVKLDDTNLRAIAMACDALEVDGVRPDIIISKTAITYAAFQGRTEVILEDMKLAAQLTLSHRTRRGGLLEPPSSDDIDRAITKAAEVSKKSDRRKSPTEVPKEEESTEEKGERRSDGSFGRQSSFAQFGRQDGKKKLPEK
jgi:magnesium chelatase subunit D